MKKLFVAVAAITMLFSACNSPKEQYKLDGTITGAKEEKVFLSKIEDNKLVKIDSAIMKDGKFTFTGNVDAPDMRIIQIDGKRGGIQFFIENSPITITADMAKMHEAKVLGSKNQDIMNAFEESQKPFAEKSKTLYAEYSAAKKANDEAKVAEIEKAYEAMTKEQEAATQDFIKKNNNTIAGAALAAQMAGHMKVDELKELFNSLGAVAKASKFGKEISDKIARIEKLVPGKPSPTFDFENFKGGKTSLASLKGKVVYVDVWATWCGPCRGEIPSLQKVEEAYHGKDIAFVSISVDKDHDAWKKMVEEKKLGGIQLFADNAWSSDFVKAYDINGIPRFILIDKNGNIVNHDAPRPSNPELKKLLDETLAK